jgi:Tfp pilus assembly protein PilO
MMGLQSIDWQQKPNSRERVIFFAALFVFFLGFMKACWLPSREAISELKGELQKAEQELGTVRHLQASPEAGSSQAPQPASLSGVGSLKDVRSAITTISQPFLLRGVKMTGVQASDLEHEGSLVSQKVELNLSGSFYSMAEYLEAIESLSAPIIIEDFSLTLNDVKLGRVSAIVKGRFYGMDR